MKHTIRSSNGFRALCGVETECSLCHEDSVCIQWLDKWNNDTNVCSTCADKWKEYLNQEAEE